MIIKKDEDFTFQTKEVAEEFETHVREQLPWYEQVKHIIVYIVRSYVNRNGLIYDIGCSTGNIARSLEKTITKRNVKLIGIDSSKEMLSLCPAIIETYCGDALTYEYKEYDIAILFLVGMFFDSNKRKDFLEKLYRTKKRNGVMIIVDKFAASDSESNGYFSTVMNRFNMLLKLENKLGAEEILNKELSLSGIQIPLQYEELPGKPIEFFRMGEFRGFVIP